ncbi:MAG: SDR family NAD(P)-dependent oxidoreductase [Niveispirillum sp.]|uniref:SDR family NAD(P)-dependent oxidoreductase n=1 Tax=Niveispirillum sp. TaxID=1917217 RepID=UPI0040360973
MSIYADRFKGQVAIVTGGASGVGREVAARLTQEGAKVVLWDMNADALTQAQADTGAVDAISLDVTDAEAVQAAADAVAQKLGRVDVLIASAGITGATVPVQEFPLDSWRRVIDINLNGLFYCCRAVIPHMLKNDYGRIVNVSSVAGKEGNPNASAYSASKAGVIGFTKSLGKELAKTGIRVNALTPATFKSPILEQLPQSQVDYMLSKIPAGRLGEVHEVAAMISWMASAECSFTTASTFDISGGRTTY